MCVKLMGAVHHDAYCVLIYADVYSRVLMCADVRRCAPMCTDVKYCVLMLTHMIHPSVMLKIRNGPCLGIKKSRPIWSMPHLRNQESGEKEGVSHSKN